MDFELIKQLAINHRDKTFVFVGPYQCETIAQAGLDKLPNLIFTGSKPITALPAYLRYFDCAIIPYLKTETTKYIYPLKINEYLAAGLPVVTTHFSDDLNDFESVVSIEEKNEDFIRKVESSISTNSPELIKERMIFAANNSWAKRVEQFWELLHQQRLTLK